MDEIDRKIITQLQTDGRTTLEDIASKINCDLCSRYETDKCLGCPTTIHYRGTL